MWNVKEHLTNWVFLKYFGYSLIYGEVFRTLIITLSLEVLGFFTKGFCLGP